MRTKIKTERGITYLDLLAGLSMMGLLLVISIPNGADFYGKKTVAREARLLAANLDYLSQLAHITARKAFLKKTASGYRGEDNHKRQLLTRHLPSGITLELSNNIQSITLFPKGTTTPTTALLSKGEFECRVILSLRGRSQVVC